MELNISELDNNVNTYTDNFDYNDYNQENYWEKQQIHETKPKKSKVSFDDILSNMNLVVNNQGVLQMMTPIQNNSVSQTQKYYSPNEFYAPQQTNYNYPKHPQQNFQQQNYPQQIKKNSEPLDPNVKHSYIYNKYFKEYNDSYVEPQGPRVPKTMEEYKQMLLDDKIKAIQHKKLLEQIKPKKMMFISNPGMSLNPTNINATKNNLRMMNFR